MKWSLVLGNGPLTTDHPPHVTTPSLCLVLASPWSRHLIGGTAYPEH